MPAVGLSTGRSLGCASVKKSLVSMDGGQHGGQRPGGGVRLHGSRQHHHVRLDVQLPVLQQVRGLNQELIPPEGLPSPPGL